MKPQDKTDLFLPALSLLASGGTLICCALPALMVSIGAGAAVAGLVSAVPQLIWLSEHKSLVFGVAGILIALAAGLQYKNRNAPCPADPKLAQACLKLRRVSRWILAFSALVYAVGFFFAFLAVKFLD